jgi:hypothetical protein
MVSLLILLMCLVVCIPSAFAGILEEFPPDSVSVAYAYSFSTHESFELVKGTWDIAPFKLEIDGFKLEGTAGIDVMAMNIEDAAFGAGVSVALKKPATDGVVSASRLSLGFGYVPAGQQWTGTLAYRLY